MNKNGFVVLWLILIIAVVSSYQYFCQKNWTERELRVLNELVISKLNQNHKDPSNNFSRNDAAAKFGQKVFFDPRFSATGNISCATCHQPERYFTDGKKVAMGISEGVRNTMTVVGSSYSKWQFWDGRKDSLWAQALEPLENPVEHGGTRLQYAKLLFQDQHYKELYEELFGKMPSFLGKYSGDDLVELTDKRKLEQKQVNRIFSNLGKAIAAYEEKLQPGKSRFDTYVSGLKMGKVRGKLSELTQEEIKGLKLFIGKAKCINCHNGPLLTNNEFHNTGVPKPLGSVASNGRIQSVWHAIADDFNCMNKYSDAKSGECLELKHTRVSGHELSGAHKVPSLRNIEQTGPYMYAGQFKSLEEVVNHYNHAPEAAVGKTEIAPLLLTKEQQQQLVSFLKSLTAPIASPQHWLQDPSNNANPS